jgi:peptidoglycan/LPS O-acetylase OafA/YrhL
MKIQDTLKERANNFTLLRFFAALAVLYSHSYALSLGTAGGEDPRRILIPSAPPLKKINGVRLD